MKLTKGIKRSWVVVLPFIMILIAFTNVSADELSLAAIMYGHANEGTWDPSAYEALMKVKKDVNFTLHLNEATKIQGAEKACRDWAGKGAKIVFTHSDIYTDQLIKVARQYKDVYFIGELSLDPRSNKGYESYSPEKMPPNVIFIGDTPYEGNYLAGYAAGLMTETGKIGILQPFESPGLNRFSNCFIFGARAANANIKTSVVMIGDYVAPAETRDSVKSLAQQGCDIVFAILDDNSAILESAVQGIYCIPKFKDKVNVAPKTVITSVVYDWYVPLKGVIKAISEGTFKSYRDQNFFRGLSFKEGSLYLGKYGVNVPEKVKKAVNKMHSKILNGSVVIKKVDTKLN